MIEIIISLLLIIGTFFILSSSIGVLRFPDVYTRLHAATKSATLGVASIMIAAFLFMLFDANIVSGKLILGILFVLLTSPVSGHMISRAAHHSGVKLWEKSIKDDYETKLESIKKKT
ncbi:multisubunit sodium/proton antiporter MrpG subunit [Melghiribacillus thermohalophilus]|uniref:Multisubunit sodium/proton antiporter MrpG subunit n=1 Tax=Melghiribacillus thermohalophilus TaxID=1324956 RepID=A0A4R3NIE9_9BACI|nr:monovalent cation/H(+) antiporter subunit G [Melghiribacillus thermohalophilus]TCT27062.1 multisubunit sodium/proton antiporter MrpG subunit [Melghiribacillus thermohalophilus]